MVTDRPSHLLLTQGKQSANLRVGQIRWLCTLFMLLRRWRVEGSLLQVSGFWSDSTTHLPRYGDTSKQDSWTFREDGQRNEWWKSEGRVGPFVARDTVTVVGAGRGQSPVWLLGYIRAVWMNGGRSWSGVIVVGQTNIHLDHGREGKEWYIAATL